MEEKNHGIGGITFTGAITVNGPMFDIHDNQHVHIHTNGKENDPPLTVSDKNIKAAIEELLKAKDEKDEFVFKNKKQWWAVYRVLSKFCSYPTKMTAFVTKMNDLQLDYADNTNVITYDSLSAAPKDVTQMSCSPASWNTLKDINENYRQQYVVAELLMLKLGIKS